MRAADVGGIASIERPFFVNRSNLVWFTAVELLVLSYSITTKRSRTGEMMIAQQKIA